MVNLLILIILSFFCYRINLHSNIIKNNYD
jgi:hypothetical protein